MSRSARQVPADPLGQPRQEAAVHLGDVAQPAQSLGGAADRVERGAVHVDEAAQLAAGGAGLRQQPGGGVHRAGHGVLPPVDLRHHLVERAVVAVHLAGHGGDPERVEVGPAASAGLSSW